MGPTETEVTEIKDWTEEEVKRIKIDIGFTQAKAMEKERERREREERESNLIY